MNTILVFAFACFAASSAYNVQDARGQEYYLVPLHRQRRQATGVDIRGGAGGGVRTSLNHQGTIFNNGVHRLDGAASASKQFHPSGPLSVTGQLGYSHVPSGSGLNVGAQHTHRGGTDLSASGNANIWRRGNSRLDAVGNYNRHYGGPWGTGRPNYYGGLKFSHRF
ncbi:hypothetical protein Zmor_024009 [Zophobas morio]|uniref:Attacin C-terminal domain-containing protein n=1 Tax=Zophobas morio TaxID=2755281 RepID=A0AA38HY36_9CUCU|nr:hypothetical protein Zmor_024009 [Zophobas morio]